MHVLEPFADGSPSQLICSVHMESSAKSIPALIQVEAWNGNTRTVHFTMPMQLPAVIKKLIGTAPCMCFAARYACHVQLDIAGGNI